LKSAKPQLSKMTLVNNVRAYGGILLDLDGRILLRRPRNDFDGYVWTFPKGRSDLGETAAQTALREVKEETGYSAKVVVKLPGLFKGGSSITEFFLMLPVGLPTPFDNSETSEIRWATLEQAEMLIGMTTNTTGKGRDLSVLKAVRDAVQLGYGKNGQ
jgi:8-oxo-dGTP pyrophosphatase MutT (NUDIX family)